MKSTSRRGLLTKQTYVRRSDGSLGSAQEIECAKCHKIEQITVAGEFRAMGDAKARKAFQAKGWLVHSTRAICPACQIRHHHEEYADHMVDPPAIRDASVHSEPLDLTPGAHGEEIKPYPPTAKEEAMETARLTDLADIRTPDRATKQRIHAAIQGYWDDDHSRYLGNASDELIARDLKCPRKWVEDIRVEWFGDSGANQDIENLKADLDAKIGDVDKLVEGAMTLAQKFDTLAKEIKDMRKRLERIETNVLPRR